MFKRITLALLLFVSVALSLSAHAQAPSAPAAKQTEQYCMVMATAKFLSTKVLITLDYGQETKLFSANASSVVKDEAGKIQSFNSVVDALNYMNTQGWEFVNAYSITVANQNVYHYLMRRKVI